MKFSFGSFVKILQLVGPFVLAEVGVPATLVPAIVHGIALAEQAGVVKNMDGSQKKAYLMDVAQTTIYATNTVKQGAVPDPGAALSAVDKGVDATVAIINAVQAHTKPATTTAASQQAGN